MRPEDPREDWEKLQAIDLYLKAGRKQKNDSYQDVKDLTQPLTFNK